jgi:hypothetical protein
MPDVYTLVVLALAVIGLPGAVSVYFTHLTKYGRQAARVTATAHMFFIFLFGTIILLSLAEILPPYLLVFASFLVPGFYYWYLQRCEREKQAREG